MTAIGRATPGGVAAGITGRVASELRRQPRAGAPPVKSPVVAVIPVKVLTAAKSRLCLPDEVRQNLALCFALDVIAAALSCAAVNKVVVLTDDSRVRRATAAWPVYRLPDPFPTTLSSLVDVGCGSVREQWPTATTLVIPADMPALNARDLDHALGSAAGHSAAFVRDAAGCGTTLLLRTPGSRVRASYGWASAKEHVQRGCMELTRVGPSLRQDVDTLADLAAAEALGLGCHTQAALTRDGAPTGRPGSRSARLPAQLRQS